MFLINKRRSADAHTEQLLYQTDKNNHWRCSIKNTVLKRFAIFTGTHLCWNLFFNFIKKRLQDRCFTVAKFWRTYAYGCFWADFRKWLSGTMILDSRFQNHPDSVILPKYQSLSNQSFKYNSAHMSSLYLNPTLPFEPRFHMVIINCYYTKSKRLESLDSLL